MADAGDLKAEQSPTVTPSCENHSLDDHADSRRPSPTGQSRGKEPTSVDPVEAALAVGIEAAALALSKGMPGALETMQALASELQARREARANVVRLDDERARRKK
jgi:hypothetical protein